LQKALHHGAIQQTEHERACVAAKSREPWQLERTCSTRKSKVLSAQYTATLLVPFQACSRSVPCLFSIRSHSAVRRLGPFVHLSSGETRLLSLAPCLGTSKRSVEQAAALYIAMDVICHSSAAGQRSDGGSSERQVARGAQRRFKCWGLCHCKTSRDLRFTVGMLPEHPCLQ
jgi:hypothetical protein